MKDAITLNITPQHVPCLVCWTTCWITDPYFGILVFNKEFIEVIEPCYNCWYSIRLLGISIIIKMIGTNKIECFRRRKIFVTSRYESLGHVNGIPISYVSGKKVKRGLLSLCLKFPWVYFKKSRNFFEITWESQGGHKKIYKSCALFTM